MLSSSTKILSQIMMFATVLAVGGTSFYSFLGNEREAMVALYGDTETEILNPHTEHTDSGADVRKPASLNAVTLSSGNTKAVKTKVPGHAETLGLDCMKSGALVVRTNASHLRLTGELCGEKQKLSNVASINRSNGFTANAFVLPKNKFTSDYIHLREGSNDVLLTLESESGSRTIAQLKILRE